MLFWNKGFNDIKEIGNLDFDFHFSMGEREREGKKKLAQVNRGGKCGIMSSWWRSAKMTIYRKKWRKEATKGCLVVILECLQTLLTGAIFRPSPPSSHQPSPFVFSVPLSLSTRAILPFSYILSNENLRLMMLSFPWKLKWVKNYHAWGQQRTMLLISFCPEQQIRGFLHL